MQGPMSAQDPGTSGVEVKALSLDREICSAGTAPFLFCGSVGSIVGRDGVGRKELGLPSKKSIAAQLQLNVSQ